MSSACMHELSGTALHGDWDEFSRLVLLILYLMIHVCVVCWRQQTRDLPTATLHVTGTQRLLHKCVNKCLSFVFVLFFKIRVHQVRASGPGELILYMQVYAVRKKWMGWSKLLFNYNLWDSFCGMTFKQKIKFWIIFVRFFTTQVMDILLYCVLKKTSTFLFEASC